MFDRRLVQNFDWILVLILLLLTLISVINLYSATYPMRNAGGMQIFMKQTYWFLIGFVVMLLATTFDYHLLQRLALPGYFVVLGLLVLVSLVGGRISGSQRWLSIGGFTIQPSEFMKMAIVILLAKFFDEHLQPGGYRLRDLWQPFLYMAIPCALIVKQPDLGTSLMILIIAFSLILFARMRWKSFMILVVAGMGSAPLLWFKLKDYQQRRILTFIDPELDPLGAGYHIQQSKIAIGSGMFWGKGFLHGTQTSLHFLPEQHTDFAFSVLAEEWGFLGSLILLVIYFTLILWGLSIAANSRDRFGALIAFGVVTILFWQLVINVCMTTGLLPVVGIPLVLISYGGSSVLSVMAGLGLLLNISMRRFMFQ
ncbi:MAG: rod shape-determining protein RodA [Deltaproteobacteria bacterium HGW-Deltaproteobacteria-15]|jgi:rod shape determining protein RodA|nr:MAG: rod shape-determining protein RodA [Deltaproteobacteria bacterium HGW-Deltaproteobacteria-15]